MKLFVWEHDSWGVVVFALANNIAEAREMARQNDLRHEYDHEYITKKEPRIYDAPMSIILYSDVMDVHE